MNRLGKRTISRLTTQELVARRDAAFDLAAGYPRIRNPDWICAIAAGSNLGGLYRGGESQSDSVAHTRLIEAALKLLGCRHFNHEHIFVALTGSIALERTITAFSDERSHVNLAPDIDIIPELTREATVRCERRLVLGDAGFDDALIHTLCENAHSVLTFSSPNNPTGHSLSADQIHTLGVASSKLGGGLILDQCFALLREPGLAPFAVDHLDPHGDWAVIWDTGKTFGLSHEKFALIFASPSAAPRVRDSLSVLQFDVPSRIKHVFAELFSHSECTNYLNGLRYLASRNHRHASDVLAGICHVHSRNSGAFACLKPIRFRGIDALSRLEKVGIGVVSGECFTEHQSWSDLLRIALLRDPEYFDAAVSAIAEALV